MIIACPSCDARYVVDPAKIGPDGRRVKCAKCGHTWAEAAPPPDDLADDIPAETSSPPEPSDASVADALQDRIGREASEPDDTFDDEDGTEEDFRARFEDAFSAGGQSDSEFGGDQRRASVPALPREPRKWPARIAWILLTLVVGGTVAGFVAFQNSIVTAWPASKKLYDTVGLTPKPPAKDGSPAQSFYSFVTLS